MIGMTVSWPIGITRGKGKVNELEKPKEIDNKPNGPMLQKWQQACPYAQQEIKVK